MITVDMIMDMRPCYHREQVERLFAGRESITLVEYCEMPIYLIHIAWGLVRFASKEQLEAAHIALISRALTDHALGCGVKEVQNWAERWLSGEDRTKLSAYGARSAIFVKLKDSSVFITAIAIGRFYQFGLYETIHLMKDVLPHDVIVELLKENMR